MESVIANPSEGTPRGERNRTGEMFQRFFHRMVEVGKVHCNFRDHHHELLDDGAARRAKGSRLGRASARCGR